VEGKLRRSRPAFTGLILLGAIALLFGLQEMLIPGSLSAGQVLLISRQASALGIIALGQALVILSGGIDLSVGSMVLLTNVFAIAWMRGSDLNFARGVLLCLAMGAAVGAANALGALVLKIAPFVMTLCTMTILQGICFVYTKGAPTGSAAPLLRQLGTGYLFGIVPYSTALWLLFSLILWYALTYTAYGRRLYAVGGNLKSARLCGISTFRVQFGAYVLSALLSTVAGLLMSGYINTTSLSISSDFVNNSLAAVLIGGNAIEGGRGGIWGVALGAFFIMLLFAILTMLSIGEAGKLVAQGLIIFIVVAGQGLLKRGKGERA